MPVEELSQHYVVNHPLAALLTEWASCFVDSTYADISTGSTDSTCPDWSFRANFFVFCATNKSRSLTRLQLLHSQTLPDSFSFLLIALQKQVFGPGASLSIRSTFTSPTRYTKNRSHLEVLAKIKLSELHIHTL